MIRRFGVFLAGAILVSVTLGTAGVQAAGKPAPGDPRIGADISWPQCGKTLPTDAAFGIVGVNGGKANNTNPCLSAQLQWAFTKTSGLNQNQPKVQLYVNTANPGEVLEQYQVDTWPTDNIDPRGRNSLNNPTAALNNTYGECVKTPGAYRESTNSLACSWQYGWNRAVEAVDQRLVPAAQAAGQPQQASAYRWWLDVETLNSWQTAGTPEAYARNTATLEGMKQFYNSEGAVYVGVYSTSYQWGQIVGNTLSIPNADAPAVGGNLKNVPSWLAGASSEKDATKRCTTLKGLTGGPVVMNQYISRNIDYNYSCS